MILRRSRSGRNQNHIAVFRRIARADDSQSLWDAPFEIGVGLELKFHPTTRFHEGGPSAFVVRLHEFSRHEDRAALPVGQDDLEHLQHRRHPAHQRHIHRLDAGPRRKIAVRNDERVRMPHPCEQRENAGIQDALLEGHKISGLFLPAGTQ